MRRRHAIAVLLAAVAATAWAAALTTQQRAVLLAKVLAYDRGLAARAGAEVTVGVAFRPSDPLSEAERDAMLRAFEALARATVIRQRSLRVVAVPFESAAQFDAALAQERPAALYLCPGLEASLSQLTQATRRRRVLTFSGARSDVEAGVSVGLVNRGLRAGIVVNLDAAKQEGADLEPDLLGLIEVLR